LRSLSPPGKLCVQRWLTERFGDAFWSARLDPVQGDVESMQVNSSSAISGNATTMSNRLAVQSTHPIAHQLWRKAPEVRVRVLIWFCLSVASGFAAYDRRNPASAWKLQGSAEFVLVALATGLPMLWSILLLRRQLAR